MRFKKTLLIWLAIAISAFAVLGFTAQGIDFTVKVGALDGGEVSAGLFKMQEGLRVDVSSTSPYFGAKVASFGYMRTSNNAFAGNYQVTGTHFTQEILDDLQQAKAGDVVYIDKIVVATPNGRNLKMGALVYKLI